MKSNKPFSSVFNKKQSINIAALIVCFVIACGIWIYAQATDDAINTKTYNQLQITVDGVEVFNNAAEDDGYRFDALGTKSASITIRGTNRDLAKFDEQNIQLAVDIRNAVDGVATVKAYVVDNSGGKQERVELKDYDITPAVVTVKVYKEVDCLVEMLPTVVEKDSAKYQISLAEEGQPDSGLTCGIRGLASDISHISSVKIRLDLLNFDPNITSAQQLQITSVSFVDADNKELFNNVNPGEGIQYVLPSIKVNVAPLDQLNGK